MTKQQCDGDHSTFYVLITAAATIAILFIVFDIIDKNRLQTVGDAVCADQGHGPFVDLKDGMIHCEAKLFQAGRLDGLGVRAVAPP